MTAHATLGRYLLRSTWLALPILLSACAAEPTLVGFPAREIENEGEEADALLADIARIDASIETVTAEGVGTRPERLVSDDEVRETLRAIFDAQLVLSDEHFDYDEPPQEDRPGRPPIILYPRLVCPEVAEPVEIVNSEGKDVLHWFVPIVFDLNSIYWDDSFATVWLGWPPERVQYDNPGYHLTLWMVPHGKSDGELQRPILLNRYLLDPPDLSVPLEGGARFGLPDVMGSRSSLGLSIPVRGDSSPDGVEPGYYDIRLFPRIRPEGVQTAALRAIALSVTEGDWYGALEEIQSVAVSLSEADAAEVRQDFGKFVDAIDDFAPTWFNPELSALRVAFARVRDGTTDLEGQILRLEGAIRALMRQNLHPAPVLLDPPADPSEPFTFIVSADWQYHADMTNVFRFLGLVDPGFLPSAAGETARHALVSKDIQERIRTAKFVIAVGDLGDGKGLSSSPGQALVTSLGLAPPLSPYDLEFDDLRNVLSRFRLPVFGVPGNHDGFANYGGLPNNVFAVVGRGLRTSERIRPAGILIHFVGEVFTEVAAVLPVGFKFLRIVGEPFFDGLVQWRFHLGPTQFAFGYRGHSFVGVNSYNLDVQYRDQVGPLANNWGGGVQRHDAVWFDVMLRRLRGPEPGEGEAPKRQFAFLHHDPRAARPYVHSYEEGGFGAYDAAEAPINALTFGYLGLGWSSNNPLWIPVITPIASNLPSQLLRGDADFNQEWMKRSTVHDVDCFGARPLIEAVNRNLAEGPGGSGLSHLFFGHDDVPVVSQWVDMDQGGRVFPTKDGGDWPSTMWGALWPAVPFFRTRTVAPPEWGRSMNLRDGRNAVVMRCDDVGQTGSSHGFHLVTVDPSKEPPNDVTIEWIEIP